MKRSGAAAATSASHPRGRGQAALLLTTILLPVATLAFLPPSLLSPWQSKSVTTTFSGSKATTTVSSHVKTMFQSSVISALVSSHQRRSSRMVMMSTSNNQMSPESYTEKAWDVITRLPQLATRNEAQFIDTEALLKSLLEEGPQALANRIFFKAGVKVSQLETDLDKFIASEPKVPDAPNKVRKRIILLPLLFSTYVTTCTSIVELQHAIHADVVFPYFSLSLS